MTDPTREQIDRSSINDLLADIQQAVASGEFVMAQTDGERIEQLERQLRCVQIYGYGYLLNHGGKQIELDPKDVTVVLPAARHLDDFDLHNSLYLAEQQVQVLQDRIAKVREIRDNIECTNCEHPAKLHKGGRCLRMLFAFGNERECGCDWGGGDIVRQLDAVLDGEGEKTDG